MYQPNSYGIISTTELNLSLLLLIHLHSFQLKNLDQHRERWTSLEKWIDRQRKVNKRFHAATRVDRAFAFFRLAFFPFPPRILIKKKRRERKRERQRGKKIETERCTSLVIRYTCSFLSDIAATRCREGEKKKGFRWPKQVDAIVELDSFHLCSFRPLLARIAASCEA